MMPDKKTSRFIAQPGDFVLIKPGKAEQPAPKPETEKAKAKSTGKTN